MRTAAWKAENVGHLTTDQSNSHSHVTIGFHDSSVATINRQLGSMAMGLVTIDVPLRITVELVGDSSGTTSAFTARSAEAGARSELERVDIGPNYSNREGYDPDFLGLAVALPPLNDEQRRNAAKNSMAKGGEDSTVLPYHHFSLVMNRRRQLAYYTAVNIDGTKSKKPLGLATSGTSILVSLSPSKSARTSTHATTLIADTWCDA